MRIYTIGHSSRELSQFISLLHEFEINLIVDVRSYPTSTRYPQFNGETLKRALELHSIEYTHMPSLGGLGRDYRQYMRGEKFSSSISKLIDLSRDKVLALVCAERDWRRCHRRFISETLVVKGIEVIHIISKGRVERHPIPIF